MHLIEKETPTLYITTKQDVPTVFRPSPEKRDYKTAIHQPTLSTRPLLSY